MSDVRFISLGMGRYVRADRVLAVVPVEGDQRGPGRRTLLWLDGVPEPIIASRGEQGIMNDLVSAGVLSFEEESDADQVDDAPDVEPPPSLF